MDLPDWLTNMSLYHYLVAGGGVVVVLALVLYFTPVSRLKIPGIIFGIIGGLGMGIALGVIAMTFYGYQLKPTEAAGEGPPQGGTGPGGGPPGMMGMMGGGPRGMGGGPPGMMGGRPNPKTQLATLVAKLDVLTNEPLAVRLNEEQKKKMREQLQTLDEQESLSDEDAKARLDALLDIVKEQRPTLEAAGYRWPGGGGGGRGGRPAALPNPFRDEQNGKHLKALQNQLSKKTA
jgi:hypothetical protein